MSRVLAEIAGRIVTLLGYDGADFQNIHVDVDGDLQIDTRTSALPTGAATSDNQTAFHDDMLIAASAMAVFNLSLVLADTEYSQALPNGTRKFLVKCRGLYDMQLAFTVNQSDVIYLTISTNTVYWEDLLVLAGKTLYIQCATAGQVAEIVAWA